MTRERVLAMKAGRELDADIAEKIMGIKVHFEYSPDGPVYLLDSTLLNGRYHVKNYSTNISAAWDVVEKMQETKLVRLFANGEDYICKIGGDLMFCISKCNSMPEAVCKAALLAVMEL